MIELITLGGASVRQDGVEITRLPRNRQKFAVLIYLAVEGPVPRDRLIGLFWPDRTERRARHALSQVLYALKGELGDACLDADDHQIRLNPTQIRLDAEHFESAVSDEDWLGAVELYGGPFLDGFYITGAAEFEHWQEQVRARLARLARRAFAGAIQSHIAADRLPKALSVAWRWTGLEPLADEAQHALIALLARAGDRSAALKQYDVYRERLAEEMGVEPLEATVQLVERIRAGEVPEPGVLSQARGSAAGPRSTGDVDRESEPAEPESRPDGGVPGARTTTEEPELWRVLLRELQKRRVFQVALLYIGFGWVAIQVADILIQNKVVPQWVFSVLLFFLVVGFPLALVLAWAQEQKSDERPPLREVVPWPAWMRKIHGGHVLAVLAVLLLGLLAWQVALNRRGSSQSSSSSTSSSTPRQTPSPSTAGQTLAASEPYDPRRIAVLYFDDQSPNQDLDPLARGLTETLIQELAQVGQLEVIPFNGVKPWRHSEVPLDSIVRALRVGTVVGGSIIPSGDSLRVSVALIDAATGTQIDSKNVDGARGETLHLLDDVAGQVSRFLRQRLGVEIHLRQLQAGTSNPEAWELVERAEGLRDEAAQLWTAGDSAGTLTRLGRADSLLARAASLDNSWTEPAIDRGWISIARARYESMNPRLLSEEGLREASAQADSALARDSGDAAALELRGTARFYLSQQADSAEASQLLVGAERDLQAAVTADSSRARAWVALSDLLRVTTRFAEARLAAERALQADAYLKDADVVIFNLYQASLDFEDYDAAQRWCSEGLRRFPGEAWTAGCTLMMLASPGGPPPNVKQAWQLYERFDQLTKSPHDRAFYLPIVQMRVAAAIARAKLPDSARAVMRRARARMDSTPGADPERYILYYEANVHQLLGEPDRAVELLGDWLRANPQRRDYLAKDWWWRGLRDDAGFRSLIEETD